MITKLSIFSIFWTVLNFCASGHAHSAPKFIHPCNNTSRECLMKAAQDAIPEFVKGIPQFGMLPLDPFVMEKLPIQLLGIAVTFYNGTITGFRNCIVDNVEAYVEKRRFTLEAHCNLTVKGQYEALGNLLLFPIDGAGDAKIELTNTRMKMDINVKYVKDDEGLTHINLTDYSYDFDFGDKVWFDIKNLFRDSPEWSKKVLEYLNEYWKILTGVMGPPIIKHAVDVVVKTVMQLFHAVPCKELISVPFPDV